MPASTGGPVSAPRVIDRRVLEVLEDAVLGEGGDDGGNGPDDAPGATDLP